MCAKSHTNGLISGWYWRRSSASSKSTSRRVLSRARFKSRTSASRDVTAPLAPAGSPWPRCRFRSPGRKSRRRDSGPVRPPRRRRCIESSSPAGARSAATATHRLAADVHPPVVEPDPGGDVPGGGDGLDGFGGDAGGNGVVEQRDQREHHRRPDGIRARCPGSGSPATAVDAPAGTAWSGGIPGRSEVGRRPPSSSRPSAQSAKGSRRVTGTAVPSGGCAPASPAP